MVITYDAVACQVWLDPLDHAPDGGQPLCNAHALRLSPPRGWVVMDRRREQSELVSGLPRSTEPPATQVKPRAPRTSNRGSGRRRGQTLSRRWGEFSEPQLVFTVDPATTGLIEDRVDTTPAPGPAISRDPEAPIDAQPEPEPVAERQPELEPVAPMEVEPEPVAERQPELEPVAPMEVESEPTTAAPAPTPRSTKKRPAAKKRPASKSRPKGRLLGRAFDLTGDQRSALTAIVGADPEADAPAGPADPEAADELVTDTAATNEPPVD